MQVLMTASKQSQDGSSILTLLGSGHHSALVSFMQVSGDRFQAESGWNCNSILTLLGIGHQNQHETYQCRMYSRKLLMMGKEDAQNM